MPLAQAGGREHQLARGSMPAQQPQQQPRRQRHDLEALARDGADPLERFARLARHQIEIFLGLGARQRVFLDDVERILRLLHVEPRQRAPRAADGIEVAVARCASATAPLRAGGRSCRAGASRRRRRPAAAAARSAASPPRRRGPCRSAPARRCRRRDRRRRLPHRECPTARPAPNSVPPRRPPARARARRSGARSRRRTPCRRRRRAPRRWRARRAAPPRSPAPARRSAGD